MILEHKFPHEDFRLRLKVPQCILGVQIVMETKRMGLLLLGRDTSFNPAEIEMLKAAESQLDSAIVQAHNVSHFSKQQ